MKLQWSKIRNSTLFLSGLGGVAHETIITASERPSLLIVFTAMMGLPVVIGKDENPPPPSGSATEIPREPSTGPQEPTTQNPSVVEILQDPIGSVMSRLPSRDPQEG